MYAIVCDQNFNGESIWRLVRAKYAPSPILATFSNISGSPKDIQDVPVDMSLNIMSPEIGIVELYKSVHLDKV